MWKRKREREAKVTLRPTDHKQQAKELDSQDVEVLSRAVDRLALMMERSNFSEYVLLMQRPGRIIINNLLAGIARGLGIAIGFTVLAAILFYLLQALAVLNLPIIGDFIADIVRIVDSQLNTPSVP